LTGKDDLDTLTLNQFLVLYTWFPLAALLLFMLLIARFFGKFSGERTLFRWFLVPLTLFGTAAVRYAGVNQMAGDGWGDLLAGVGGLVLIVLSVNLVRRMRLSGKDTRSD
jgi:hypothetical protein